jgi:ABC-type transport system involved in multi-copper enzyme maturation permease subunit
MFLSLFSIEWTRLFRRTLLWLTLAVCALFTWLSLENFYTLNRVQLFDGSLKMPGIAFDLANSLDQLLQIELPFLVILAAVMAGNDYSQRTDQHWLTKTSRSTGLLAKFSLLAVVIFLLQILALVVGAGTGWYYKTITYRADVIVNVDWTALGAAALYMTLVTLPYVAFTLLITVLTRSTLPGAAIGLGYTQFVEFLLTGLFYGAGWSKWMMRNLHLSATYLLNSIGYKTVEIPAALLHPLLALVTAALYTLIFLSLAVWQYRRQDLGG